MNLLEHYIKEIHSIKEFKKTPDVIWIDVTCDCWGNEERTTHITTKEQWQKDLENGYFMA